ncbi:MAG: response regulator, partial [Oscillospiraceae bacterium]|nr:response regulator [Oscillospiraceae bacterium]
MLEGFGLTVHTAGSGGQAVEMARNQDFFLIFMDIHMPDMDGYTAAAHIRTFNTSVPIIALTADPIAEVEAKLEQSGMNGHLSKPLQTDQLNTLLQMYMSVAPVSVQESADTFFDADALGTVFHDEKTVNRLLRQFLSSHSGDCALLKECIQAEDFLGAREIVHNIIGISGNLFCKKLYHAASRLGANLRLSHAESFDMFEDVWKKTLLELRMYL